MLAPIVIVGQDAKFVAKLADELRDVGLDTSEFTNPMAFVDALVKSSSKAAVEVLVTEIQFGPGKPHGYSIANMLTHRRPAARVVFLGWPALELETTGSGEFVSLPTSTPRVLTAVLGLLNIRPSDPLTQGSFSTWD